MAFLKGGLILLLIPVLLFSCKKEQLRSGRELIGVWVDIAHPADTLVITREAGGTVLFDNSLAYRTNLQTFSLATTYRYYIRSGDDIIATKPLIEYGVDNAFESYSEFPFEWLEPGRRFKIEPGAFRPYISCRGCMLTFEKVR